MRATALVRRSATLLVGPLLVVGLALPAGAASASPVLVTDVIQSGGATLVTSNLRSQMWTPNNGTVNVTGTPSTGVDVLVTGGTAATPGRLQLQPAFGQLLAVGTYQALVNPDPTHIGFQLNGDCMSTGTSTVVIKDLVVDAASQVTRLWVTYSFLCQAHDPTTVGEIRFNEPVKNSDLTIAEAETPWGDEYPTGLGRVLPIWLINTSTAPMHVTATSFTGANATDYSLQGNSCAADVPIGGLCQLNVNFLPLHSGPSVAALNFSDTTAAAQHTAALTGYGIDGSTTMTLRTSSAPNLDLTPANGTPRMQGHAADVYVGFSQPANVYYTAHFQAPVGEVLQAGHTYTGTREQNGASIPGFQYYQSGLGCSASTGQFTVIEITLDGTGSVSNFSARFQYQCGTTAVLYGWVAWRAHHANTTTILALTGPATSPRSAALTVSGSLTESGAPVTATAMSVTRTDLAGTTPLATIGTNPSGTFEIHDTPNLGGKVTYTVTWAGDLDHEAVTKSFVVNVSQLTTQLTIATNATTFLYGGSAYITLHLGATSTSRKVSLYATTFGALQKLVGTATVNSAGNVTFWFQVKNTTVFLGSFAGDGVYAPVGVTKGVSAYGSITETLAKFYGTSAGIKLYHSTVNPVIGAALYPVQWVCLSFQAQYWTGSTWATQAPTSACYLPTSSITVVASLNGSHVIGRLVRIRALFAGSKQTLATVGGWVELRFTA